MGSEVSASAATAATNIELQKISKQFAIRSFMIKNVADGLEQQQKALEAAGNGSGKHLARIQKSATAAIRRAQSAFNKCKSPVHQSARNVRQRSLFHWSHPRHLRLRGRLLQFVGRKMLL
jgi:hypothetical protein